MNSRNLYSERNAKSLRELESFTDTLTDSQLNAPMPAGWTVSSVFAHLAFWDYRAILLISKWKKEGISDSPRDVDVLNDSTQPFFNALDPKQSKRLMLDFGQQLNELINSLDPELIHAIENKGSGVRLDRAKHREDHLTDIQAALGIQ